jgi:hypothetical protein
MGNVWRIGAWPGDRADVRACNYVERALKSGFVAVGWASIDDLATRTRRQLGPSFDDFARRIATDDLVLMYDNRNPKDKHVYVGRVLQPRKGRDTPYYPVKQGIHGIVRHRIDVKWLKGKAPFEMSLPGGGASMMTVQRIKAEHISAFHMEGKLKAIVSREMKKPMVAGPPSEAHPKPPRRGVVEVSRFFRDTTKSKRLKALYEGRCQVPNCHTRIRLSDDRDYSEVHHLHQLKSKGGDDWGNMLVLCPNHHVQFDYRVLGVDKDAKTVLNWEEESTRRMGQLRFIQNHRLDKASVRRQLELFENGPSATLS